MNYTPTEAVIRRTGLPSTELNGETVLLSLEQQSYFGLRETSQRIWQMLERPCTLAQILDALSAQYEVDRQRCEREVTAFMERLWEARLIEPASRAKH